jgi:hypothetical protein
LVFRYVFGVSLRPTKSEAIGGWNGQWNPTDIWDNNQTTMATATFTYCFYGNNSITP